MFDKWLSGDTIISKSPEVKNIRDEAHFQIKSPSPKREGPLYWNSAICIYKPLREALPPNRAARTADHAPRTAFYISSQESEYKDLPRITLTVFT
jgi:hypothetical protein